MDDSKRENKIMTMKMKTKTNTIDLFSKIDYGVHRGAAQALAEHKKAGSSIAVWKDGKVVKIPADKIVVPKEFKDVI